MTTIIIIIIINIILIQERERDKGKKKTNVSRTDGAAAIQKFCHFTEEPSQIIMPTLKQASKEREREKKGPGHVRLAS